MCTRVPFYFWCFLVPVVRLCVATPFFLGRSILSILLSLSLVLSFSHFSSLFSLSLLLCSCSDSLLSFSETLLSLSLSLFCFRFHFFPLSLPSFRIQTDDGIAPAAFDDYENVNLHGNPEFAEIEAKLLVRLKALVARWRTPWPPAKIA